MPLRPRKALVKTSTQDSTPEWMKEGAQCQALPERPRIRQAPARHDKASPSRRSTTASSPVPIPQRLQAICDGLSAAKIDRPAAQVAAPSAASLHRHDRRAGYRYDLSILQAEFALTQVLDQPVHGRLFFEQVIRENLDLGRPEQVQLIFDRRISRSTPGRSAPASSPGGHASLHVDYKNTRIKQYHKEGARCVPRRPSTTPTTSGSAGAWTICRSCARSALRPIAGCSRLNSGFKQGRDFAAWLGLVPKQESTGDRTKFGRISKRGNKYLRTLFVQAAHVVLERRPAAAMRPKALGREEHVERPSFPAPTTWQAMARRNGSTGPGSKSANCMARPCVARQNIERSNVRA